MGKETDDKKQWQKIKDIEYAGFIALGLASTSEAINNDVGFPLVAFGVFWIIIGLIQVRSWNSFYDHRIALIKWGIIFLIALMFIQAILFYISTQPFFYKGIILAVNLLLEIALIVFFLKKRTKIENMK
ncbi:hypothetical protein [Thermincola potens]|uniref:Uncharacterized protein n=1 Tax=Thermincola potens (strain JR) TaxID=635013 RepID=D5XCC5_THEPJ|nr:hypothetical protein [Thermincola potens]ADG83577.1 hypothetical protein TherJR_2743 [Thermincola potens JR]